MLGKKILRDKLFLVFLNDKYFYPFISIKCNMIVLKNISIAFLNNSGNCHFFRFPDFFV
jgi:hypothetical protein